MKCIPITVGSVWEGRGLKVRVREISPGFLGRGDPDEEATVVVDRLDLPEKYRTHLWLAGSFAGLSRSRQSR